MEQQIQVSAPGSLMLLGEHAVLRGESAGSCGDQSAHPR